MGQPAIVGVADHYGWANLVTVSSSGGRAEIIDRRQVELVDEDLPRSPIHHEAQTLPYDQAEKLVGTVRRSVRRRANRALAALAAEFGTRLCGIAIRECPALPDTLAERIASYTVQCRADSVMYRQLLAEAAESRGLAVHWFAHKQVESDAAAAAETDLAALRCFLVGLRSTLGAPWQKDHRMAAAAAIAVLARRHGLDFDS